MGQAWRTVAELLQGLEPSRVYVGTYSLYQGPEARGYSQHRAGGHRTEETTRASWWKDWGTWRPEQGEQSPPCSPGGCFPHEPSQVPMPSQNGPQLTLGELAHITLVAEDVFDALL